MGMGMGGRVGVMVVPERDEGDRVVKGTEEIDVIEFETLEKVMEGKEGEDGMEMVSDGVDGRDGRDGGNGFCFEGKEEGREVLGRGENNLRTVLFCVTGVRTELILALQPMALPLSRDEEEETSVASPWTRLGCWEHFLAQQWSYSWL